MGLDDKEKARRTAYLKKLATVGYNDASDLGYVFVSYKSDDWEKVFTKKVIPLYEQGLRVYCDKDFEYNNEYWLNNMENNVRYSSVFLMFISEGYLKSYATFLELLTAICFDIQIVPVLFRDKSAIFSDLKNERKLTQEKIDMKKGSMEWGLLNTRIVELGNKTLISKWELCDKREYVFYMDIVDWFDLILSGQNLNYNHFSTEDLTPLIETIKDAAKKTGKPIVFNKEKVVAVKQQTRQDDEESTNITGSGSVKSDARLVLELLQKSHINSAQDGGCWVVNGKKVHIRISDSINMSAGYDYYLYSFDTNRKISDIFKKKYFLLKSDAENGMLSDATGVGGCTEMKRTIGPKAVEGFQSIDLQDLVDGKYDHCMI